MSPGLPTLQILRDRFEQVIPVIPDLHLGRTDRTMRGVKLDDQSLIINLVEWLGPYSDFLVFNGDTVDLTQANLPETARDSFFFLLEVLSQHNLLSRTIFVRGNHDRLPERNPGPHQ